MSKSINDFQTERSKKLTKIGNDVKSLVTKTKN